MPIKANFTQQQIEQLLQKKAENVHRAIVSVLYQLGELCVNEARNFGSYTDRTGNLRSSVGFGVFKDGQPISYSNFEQVAKGTEGGIEGRNLLEKISGKYHNGYALIVVAGMNYAVYVEAKGYNVLSSAELLAENELPRMINELFD